ncbi:hypothetical protein RchiOBHm_Chr3g0454081 [Rosa chinensis]|uniref:Uncharacterized protein n=1 Tax=Rosa chinensis TaxID=74649 RepID=A0A2P6R6R3_ROSCH|nr:hypothetical protein RchiOBHm_Chr3g0454081 [Rosa chinensis]
MSMFERRVNYHIVSFNYGTRKCDIFKILTKFNITWDPHEFGFLLPCKTKIDGEIFGYTFESHLRWLQSITNQLQAPNFHFFQNSLNTRGWKFLSTNLHKGHNVVTCSLIVESRVS